MKANRNYRPLVLVVAVLGVLTLGAWSGSESAGLRAAPAGTAWSECEASGTDCESIDGLVKALYESISFAEGRSPDWERYRNLFASPTAPCIRLSPSGVLTMDRESFVVFFRGRIESENLGSFEEHEIGRTVETYGGLAQVFSAYEKRLNLSQPGKPGRGINALQLFFKDGRWWICSIVWQDEMPGRPLPEKYAK
jgi:hypothetical protein